MDTRYYSTKTVNEMHAQENTKSGVGKSCGSPASIDKHIELERESSYTSFWWSI